MRRRGAVHGLPPAPAGPSPAQPLPGKATGAKTQSVPRAVLPPADYQPHHPEGKGILSQTSNKSTKSHAVLPESGAREPMGGKAQQELEMRELWVQGGSGRLGVG